MQPETAKLLTDMVQAVDHVVDYTRQKTRDDFLNDKQLRDAVQWNFAVIGEALVQLHKADAPTAERITEWNRIIIAFRNQLIHGYGVIRNESTWDIIQNKVPILQADLERLLAAGGSANPLIEVIRRECSPD